MRSKHSPTPAPRRNPHLVSLNMGPLNLVPDVLVRGGVTADNSVRRSEFIDPSSFSLNFANDACQRAFDLPARSRTSCNRDQLLCTAPTTESEVISRVDGRRQCPHHAGM